MPGKCVFNNLWVIDDKYKEWLAASSDRNKAKCKICCKDFDIGRMGESALKVHMNGLKHKELLSNKKKLPELNSFFSKKHQVVTESEEACAAPGSVAAKSSTIKSSIPNSNASSTLTSHVSKNNVLDAEIIWALKCIGSHFSYNSSEGTNKLFARMCPDSAIAQMFTCGATKCSYVCCFGLAPYFNMCFMKILNEVEVFTLLFDESLNKSTQSKQMDIHVRYWRDGDQEVKTRYFTSVFLGHSEAVKILAAFYSAVQKLKLFKLLQVSMDGPFVNWKFYELLQNDLKKQHNFQTLCIGSCGLHILNNSFKHGEKATNWSINSILSSLYWLFKDAPVRREDLMKLSECEKFPLKFCCHRWLENVPCAERALEIWADVCKYVSKVDSGALPKVTCKSYGIIAQAAKDKLLTVKLNFFLSVAKMIQPFLVLYQSDKPLVPFLAGDLFTLVKNLLEHFKVLKQEKCKSIDSISSLCSFAFKDVAHFNCVDKVSLGFIGDELLKKKRAKREATDKDVLDLKRDCQRFILKMLQTLMEKCPISYSIVRNASCFDPKRMALHPMRCLKSLKSVLSYLADNSLVPSKDGDEILLQFKEFLDKVVKCSFSNFKTFDHKEQRLDAFLYPYFSVEKEKYSKLWGIVKMILILSHGQATVERGFSLNKALEVENLKENTYIAQRIIVEAIKEAGGVLNVPITKEMRISVQGARQKYLDHLDCQKREKMEEQSSNKRKILVEEIDFLQAKRKCLEEDVTSMRQSSDALAAEGEKKRDISLFLKSNALRKEVTEKSFELKSVEENISRKREELNKYV